MAIALTAGMRSNLLSLQSVDSMMQTTQNRLSTGKRVNSALDDPVNFFKAQDNYNRANDLAAKKDGMGEAIKIIETANAGIEKMEDLSLTPRVIRIEGRGWAFEELGREGALKLLASDELTTDTVLCSNDRLAIGFLSACYDMGVRVGRAADSVLRVASHDDHPFSRFTCPALTTAGHDYEAVSRDAMDTLVRLIDAGGSFDRRTETLHAARLIMRDSA